jgi:hypothetical protein
MADGYDMVLEAGHLVVHRLPYVAPSGVRNDGRLVLPINDTGGMITDATDHRIWFAGDEPRDERGTVLASSNPHSFGDGETANYMLSYKPPSGSYPSLHDKIRHYAHILRNAAQQLDPSVTDTPGAAFQVVEDGLPLVYRDTNTTRAGLTTLNNLFRGHSVAIVGVGGTGSYILDLVAKTWVDRIVLIDGDEFENHNAYRAPGAAAQETLQAKRNKAEYFAEEYSRMHTGIAAHPVALTADNLDLLDGATFVFLAAADAEARPEIVQYLSERGVPFIDVGMSFREGEGGLTGIAKVTAYLPGEDTPLPTTPAILPGDDDYSTNIQVAELNALNATLAVIRWKRYLGFYATHEPSNLTVYKLFLNELRNGEVALPGRRISPRSSWSPSRRQWSRAPSTSRRPTRPQGTSAPAAASGRWSPNCLPPGGGSYSTARSRSSPRSQPPGCRATPTTSLLVARSTGTSSLMPKQRPGCRPLTAVRSKRCRPRSRPLSPSAGGHV